MSDLTRRHLALTAILGGVGLSLAPLRALAAAGSGLFNAASKVLADYGFTFSRPEEDGPIETRIDALAGTSYDIVIEGTDEGITPCCLVGYTDGAATLTAVRDEVPFVVLEADALVGAAVYTVLDQGITPCISIASSLGGGIQATVDPDAPFSITVGVNHYVQQKGALVLVTGDPLP